MASLFDRIRAFAQAMPVSERDLLRAVCEPCRNCGGTGTGGARLLLGEWFDGKCPRCDGTGAEPSMVVAVDDLRWLLDVVRWTDRAAGLGAMDPCPHLIRPIPPGVRVLLDEMEGE